MDPTIYLGVIGPGFLDQGPHQSRARAVAQEIEFWVSIEGLGFSHS